MNDYETLNGNGFFINSPGGAKVYKVTGDGSGYSLLSPLISFAQDLAVINTTLFISGRNTSGQTVLFKSDGTTAGTSQLKVISGSTTNAFFLINCNGTLYFRANDGVNGDEPWVSDGTELGTKMLKNISAGSASSGPFHFRAAGNKVFFAANLTTTGTEELWASDGTEAGTVLVKDIFPGTTASRPHEMFDAGGGNVIFQANDGINGIELWKSDGTATGTVLVQDINISGDAFQALAGIPLNYPSTYFKKVNNGLIFTARDAYKGIQLFYGEIPRQNKFYVNDNSLTGDVFTTAIGNNANPGTPSDPYATLDFAITQVQAGDTIFVDAGTYATPNFNITKSVTILGSNYNVSPNNPGDRFLINPVRNAEAIISGSTFTIGVNNINIEGLTLDPGAKQQVSLLSSGINDFKFKRNYSKITSSIFLMLSGPTIPNGQVPMYGNYLIEDNRFEKQGTVSGQAITVGYLKDVTVNNNVFFTPATATQRVMLNCYAGFGGVAVNFRYSNNASQTSSYDLFTYALVSGLIENNTCLQSLRPLFIQTVVPGSSDIQIRNNYIESDFAINTPIYFLSSDGTLPGSSTNLLIEGNTVVQNATGKTFALLAIRTQFPGTAQNTSLVIRKNKINYIGDYSLFTSSNVIAVNIIGKLQTVTMEENEIEFNGTNLTNVLPAGLSSSGILISSDGGATNPFPSNAIMNITGNKIHGFRNSIAIYDALNAAPNTYTGYGNLPVGVILNIHNNSFTSDVVSINNGTTSQTLNATCNWYGVTSSQALLNKITPTTVNHSPWLTNGTDSDIPTVGFQPLPGVCNGIPVTVVLNASTNITCNGVNNGIINITVSGGLAPFTFSWTMDENIGFSSSVEDPTNLAPGTYHLLVTDANGSTVSLPAVIITEPELLTARVIGTNVSCFGGSNGSATVTATGGTAPFTYLWSNAATTNSISSLTAGNYTVTVTDAHGCLSISNYTVTQPALLTVTMSGVVATCNGSATATPAGGTAPYSYLWNNGLTTQTINVPHGTYSVIVTDANNCTVPGAITITGDSHLNPTVQLVHVTCFGLSNGSVTITGAGGVAPHTYNLNGSAFQNNNLFPGLTAGNYLVGVKDANGCADFVTKTINQPDLLTVATDKIVATCPGTNKGSIKITASGGNGGNTYSWTGPAGYSSTNQDINNLAPGDYTVTVTDSKGCIASLTVSVSEWPAITISEVITQVACRGGATGAINITVSGGSGSGFTYKWTGSNGMNMTTEDVSGLAVGTYTIKVTDNLSNCSVTKSYAITQPDTNLALNTARTNVNGCLSLGTITATASGGTPGYQYSIDGTNYQSSGFFGGLEAANYTAWAKDANGCTKSKNINITDDGDDQYEDNNAKNQAKLISIEVAINARIALANDVADWFKFTTPAGGGNYRLSFNHPAVSYIFNMYASGNNTPALIPVSTTPISKDYVLAGNITYYISITGGLSYTCYQLSVNPAVATRTGNGNLYTEKSKPEIPAIEILIARVYPNPHQGNFTLQIESPEDGIASIQLLSADGRLITTKNEMLFKGRENTVAFSNIREAVLFYRVRLGKHSTNGKIIGPK